MRTLAIASTAAGLGFVLGQTYQPPPLRELPSGLPRTCCDNDGDTTLELTDAQKELPSKLARLVGPQFVLDASRGRKFLVGARPTAKPGAALCVVQPQQLHQVPLIVQAIVDAHCALIPQGRNTGLTGGSVPRSNMPTDRPVVLLSLDSLQGIFPLDHGRRLCCLPGTGLGDVADFLAEHFPDREAHSVLGSTFLNPTCAAGVALGSGGTQCRKGPAFTERALYLTVEETAKWKERQVKLVNTLDIEGMENDHDVADEEERFRSRKVMGSIAYHLDMWSRWVRDGRIRNMRHTASSCTRAASDVTYADRLCDCNKDFSRYNADTRGPDCVRSEGKVVVLATVHDTFPKPKATKTYWVSFDSLDTALNFRRQVCVDNAEDLPVSVEYMDRDAFDVVDQAGRVLGTTIKWVGTSSSLVRSLWNIKLSIEAAGFPLLVDQVMYAVNSLFPTLLPSEVMKTGRQMDHHVAVTIGDFGKGNMDRFMARMDEFRKQHPSTVVHDCTANAPSLTAFRFVAAPAFRTWCIGEGVQGFSVDYALPKNGGNPPSVSRPPLKRMRYSHFGCNVVHEDVAYDLNEDIAQVKRSLKKSVESECHGKLPAEHGHGTEYVAPSATKARWERMDPLNVMNPGVGGTSTNFKYKDP